LPARVGEPRRARYGLDLLVKEFETDEALAEMLSTRPKIGFGVARSVAEAVVSGFAREAETGRRQREFAYLDAGRGAVYYNEADTCSILESDIQQRRFTRLRLSG